ncbi:MAG: sulfurtransferase TusA family protein [Pseudomonadota bacterium]
MAKKQILNLIGIVSPFCLLEFKNALARFRRGQLLEVHVQDPEVVEDLIRLVERSDDRLVARKKVGDQYRILVKRAGGRDISVKEEA